MSIGNNPKSGDYEDRGPTMAKMLEDSPELKAEFEQKKAQDSKFANDPYAIYYWFYSKTKYYDSRYLLYPVGREM